MSIFEYNEEEHMKNIREEGRKEGREEGRTEEKIQFFLKLLSRGFSKEEAKELADISDELVARVLECDNR